MSNSIYHFGTKKTEGNAEMVDLLGGKGANLAEMVKMGIPIPPGFTITTEMCIAYQKESDKNYFMDMLMKSHVAPAVIELEKYFGYMPMLSVRSGSRVSMPGMMDTILNVGMSKATLEFWTEKLGERPVLDCYRRFLQMYGVTAGGIAAEKFEQRLNWVRICKYGMSELPESDAQFSPKHLERLIDYFEELYEKEDVQIPVTLNDQLQSSIKAVFESWDNPRAKSYRKMNGYSDDWGTAVNIQVMVFGNANDESGSGVLFSRDKATGNNFPIGDYVINGQGEDVVAGIVPTIDIEEMVNWDNSSYYELLQVAGKLEHKYKDMQEVEFTIQDGELFILQTRTGLRTSTAAFRIAVDMVKEGLITKDEALKRVSPKQYVALNKLAIDPDFKVKSDGQGIPVGGGVVSGVAVFTSDAAMLEIEDCILIRYETTPEDIEGMKAAVGILTATGGKTCHAAVVAGGMDKTCVVGCTQMVGSPLKQWVIGGKTILPGTLVTIDGATGNIWVDVDVPLVGGNGSEYAEEMMEWASESEGYVERVMVKEEADLKTPRKQLYIDTVAIEDDPKGLSKVLGYLKKTKLDVVYIDLRTKYDYMEGEDIVLWGAFGQEISPAPLLLAKIDALLTASLSKAVKKKVILFIPAYALKSQVESLKAEGYAIASQVDTIADLLSSDGIVDLTKEFEESVGGIVAMKKLIKLYEDAGKELQNMPKAVSKRRRMFDILGGGE